MIAKFVRRSGPSVVFATYQSSPKIAEAFALGRVPAFDLVVADEAHRCTGPAARPFATVLDSSDIKSRRRLFMTATPRYYTERVRKRAGEADFEIASMDDETRFGPVFHVKHVKLGGKTVHGRLISPEPAGRANNRRRPRSARRPSGKLRRESAGRYRRKERARRRR